MKNYWIPISIIAFVVGWCWTLDESKKATSVPIEQPTKTQVESVIDVIEPTVVVPPQIKPTILMHSSTDCVYCEQWKKQIPRWEKSGWTVDVTIDLVANPDHKRFPWFEVKSSQYSFTYDGYMTDSAFEASKKWALIR